MELLFKANLEFRQIINTKTIKTSRLETSTLEILQNNTKIKTA